MGSINSKKKTSAENSPSSHVGDNEEYSNDSRVDIEDSEKARETTSEEPTVRLPEGAVGDCMLGITVVLSCTNVYMCQVFKNQILFCVTS